MTSNNSFGPINTQTAFLPTEFDIDPSKSDKWSELLSKRERQTASIVNVKEIGIYDLQEGLAGQFFFALDVSSTNPKQLRYVFRTVVNFGALPDTTTAMAEHGIQVTNSTIFTRIYGCSTLEGTIDTIKFIPIPYVNVGTPGDGVELWVDGTNVNIKTTTSNWAAYNNTYVVLEYLKAG